ncbi:MAG: glycolate oxidase subunit GlcE [Chromatiales bacterium]|jgi:glycolate oxidase FAD binding subunit
MSQDISQQILEQVKAAMDSKTPLAISAGRSKDFLGREISGLPLSLAQHQGIVDYDPRELVMTARVGTSLSELQQTLAEQGQMLPFEPPSFAPTATLGGTLACGLSGPARPFAGSARDYVLGVQVINGRGELLNFGGRVIKNVAGYDLSRLMVGAMGTLGIITQASLKVLPQPQFSQTLVQQFSQQHAIERMNRLAGSPAPLTAAAWYDGSLYLRFAGAESSVKQAVSESGGELLEDAERFWHELREHEHEFFQSGQTLWRLSLPPATPPLSLSGDVFIDWAGAQRWYVGDATESEIRELAAKAGGHASMFRHAERQGDVFQPLPAALMKLHRNIKQSLDPFGLLNPGRMYRDL